MSTSFTRPLNRRQFLEQLTLAGTAGFLGLHAPQAVAEPPPETTRLKILKFPAACLAPQYIAEELLRGEGFTEVQYVERLDWLRGLVDNDVDSL